MNFLSLFVLIPLLMLLALVVCRNIKQVHTVSVVGSGAILVLSAYLVFAFLGERAAGNDAEMLYTDSVMWFGAFEYTLCRGRRRYFGGHALLSAIILFTGVFASWTIENQTKEYYMWLILLSLGVFGFFISIDLVHDVHVL